ncbi:MAG: peptidoglycan binding domain-containing protein, partial [Candidatus Azambacteria bacterium]|nr:peptidoglycan binding domain-containing protein [Candidatus Azambacteria bacterium]
MLRRITKLIVITAALVPLCLFFALMLCNYRAISYGVTVSGYGIGGKSIAEAKQTLAQNAAYFQYTKTTLVFGDQTWKASPSDLGVTFDIDATIQDAYRVGRTKNIFSNIVTQIQAGLVGNPMVFLTSIDERALDSYLTEHLTITEQRAVNAALVFNKETEKFEITPSKTGIVINQSMLKDALLHSAARGVPEIIILERKDDQPVLSDAALEPVVRQANQLLARAPITLTYANPTDNTIRHPSSRGQQYVLTKEQLKNLLTPTQKQGVLVAGINEEMMKNILIELAPSINQKPQNAVLTFDGDKVKEFVLSKNGIELDIPASI